MKKKIAIFTLPAMGHTTAPASLVREISSTYEVHVFTSAKYADYYSGATVHLYDVKEDEFYFDSSPIYLTEHILHLKNLILKDNSIKNIVESADYIMYDIYAFWGQSLAKDFSKKNISYGVTYSQNFSIFLPASYKYSAVSYFFRAFKDGKNIFLKNYKNAINVFKNILPHYGGGHIAFIPEFLQPSISKNKNHFYVSSSNFSIPANKKTNYIYAALGTIYLDKNLLIKIINSIKTIGVAGTVSVGIYYDDLNHLSDDNVKIVQFANQKEELEKSTLFITHAGTNSVVEAVSLSVPMVCFPQAVDQFAFASRVEKLGIGRYVPSNNISQNKLNSILKKELSVYERRIDSYKKIFASYKENNLANAAVFIKKFFQD